MPPPTSFEIQEKIRRELGPVRVLRGAALFGLLFPVALTALLVLVHKLSGGGMSFLVDVEARWTHWFWSGLFYLFVAGAFLSLLNMARKCPRCGNGFFQRKGWNPRMTRSTRPGMGFNANTFARRCLNCGLKLDGSNVEEAWKEG